MKLNKNLTTLLILACGFGAAQAQTAAEYPTKPIKMIVSFPPGGPTDSSIRIISEKLGELMKQQIECGHQHGEQGRALAPG